MKVPVSIVDTCSNMIAIHFRGSSPEDHLRECRYRGVVVDVNVLSAYHSPLNGKQALESLTVATLQKKRMRP